jgi:uncharacterized protein with NRDE domain
MCSIFFAYGSHPKYPLIVAANRDEFFDRPTAPAGYWDDFPGILAGRDLRGGGTWLGLGIGQRFAAVTNYRDPSAPVGVRSRGQLVLDFLAGRNDPKTFLAQVECDRAEFSGFNFLAADANELWYYSNRGAPPRALSAGVYGLSNHLIDTPWPKVTRGRAALEEIVGAGGNTLSIESLFEILANDRPADDSDLPDTGVGLEVERALSPIFIRTPNYGTRSATALLLEYNGAAVFCERTFGLSVDDFSDRRFEVPASKPNVVTEQVIV